MTIKWVFPMAGKGERTKDYGEFKPFINVSGKPIVEWFFMSIQKNISDSDDLIFITTEYFEKRFLFRETIIRLLDGLKFKNKLFFRFAPDTPQGPAASVLIAKDLINNTFPCIIINSDQVIDFELPIFAKNKAFLTVNLDFGESKSYVTIENLQITNLREKENISYIASTGFYGVSSGKDLISVLEKSHKGQNVVKQEYYVAPAFNFLLKLDYDIMPLPVNFRFDLGTIKNIDNFEYFIARLRA